MHIVIGLRGLSVLKIRHTFAFFHGVGYVLVVKERLYISERGVASSFDASLISLGQIRFGPGALFDLSCLIACLTSSDDILILSNIE